jgi:glyoxylase-like metal-dependent hydrolase (beta-lactamase superfamily II)
MMLGDFEITALSDGTHPFPIDTVMTHIAPERIAVDLAAAELAQPVQGSINAFLINTGGKLILVDAGAGLLYGDCCGRLLTNLRAAGYQPEQVDEVLLTHLHKDHAGGILAQGKAAFPNAVLRLSQAEADYWLTPASKAAAPDFLSTFFDAAIAAVAPYRAAGRWMPFRDFGPLEPGIEALPAPGHTPGHAIYLVQSQGRKLLLWGDIVHVSALQFPDPEASVKYDSSEADAQATRKRLLERAAREHMLVGAAHIAFPGLGHVRARGDAWEWLPLNYDGKP